MRLFSMNFKHYVILPSVEVPVLVFIFSRMHGENAIFFNEKIQKLVTCHLLLLSKCLESTEKKNVHQKLSATNFNFLFFHPLLSALKVGLRNSLFCRWKKKRNFAAVGKFPRLLFKYLGPRCCWINSQGSNTPFLLQKPPFKSLYNAWKTH